MLRGAPKIILREMGIVQPGEEATGCEQSVERGRR